MVAIAHVKLGFGLSFGARCLSQINRQTGELGFVSSDLWVTYLRT